MKKNGKRLMLPDKTAAAFQKAGIAFEDRKLVVKKPFVIAEPAETELQEPKIRRRYRRRDMTAEETNCFQESNES